MIYIYFYIFTFEYILRVCLPALLFIVGAKQSDRVSFLKLLLISFPLLLLFAFCIICRSVPDTLATCALP